MDETHDQCKGQDCHRVSGHVQPKRFHDDRFPKEVRGDRGNDISKVTAEQNAKEHGTDTAEHEQLHIIAQTFFHVLI